MKFSPYILLASLISADDVENIKKAEASFHESEVATDAVLSGIKSDVEKLHSEFRDAENLQKENLAMIEKDRSNSDASIRQAEKELEAIMHPKLISSNPPSPDCKTKPAFSLLEKTTLETSGEDDCSIAVSKSTGSSSSLVEIMGADFDAKKLFEPLQKAASTIKKFTESLGSPVPTAEKEQKKSSFSEIKEHTASSYFDYPVPGSFLESDVSPSVRDTFKDVKEQLEKVKNEVAAEKVELVKQQKDLDEKRKTIKSNSRALINAARYIPSFAFLNKGLAKPSFLETKAKSSDPLSSLASSFIERFGGSAKEDESDNIQDLERKLQLDNEKFAMLDKAEKESLEHEKTLITESKKKHDEESLKLNALNEKLNKQLSQLHRDIALAESRGKKKI